MYAMTNHLRPPWSYRITLPGLPLTNPDGYFYVRKEFTGIPTWISKHFGATSYGAQPRIPANKKKAMRLSHLSFFESRFGCSYSRRASLKQYERRYQRDFSPLPDACDSLTLG
jgi:hypothetical protein